MRASDADRDRIAAILRDAHAEGRLTQDELMERLESTYDARTYQDLDQVILDLPVARSQGQVARLRSRPVSAPASAPEAQPIRHKTRRAARVALNVGWWLWGTAVAINVLIWFLVSVTVGLLPFWPIWVAGPWGIVMLAGEVAYRRSQ